MEMASKIKNSLFTWIFAIVVTLCLAENSVGENFSYQWNESGKIESSITEGTKEIAFAYQYDASGYAIVPNSRGIGDRAPLRELTINEKINMRAQWKELGGDNRMLRFDGSKPTAFSDPTIGGNNTVNIGGNVFPLANGTHNRSLMTPRAVLAHELGHVNFAGTRLNTLSVRDWRPEFGASNWAARNAPGLTL